MRPAPLAPPTHPPSPPTPPTPCTVDTGDLQRRLRESSEMLFLKQSQLERLAADKAGAMLALERELAGARAEAQQVGGVG